MFDLKKTITLMLCIIAIVSTFIAGYSIGTITGYSKGVANANGKEHSLIIKQDSLLRKQTELCNSLIDMMYIDKHD